MKYFNNKVVLITGASSGIGFALAERLAPHARVVIMLSHDRARLDLAVEQIRKQAPHTRVEPIIVDVADSAALTIVAQNLIGHHGAPDIIVNNAGYAHYQLFHEMPLHEVVRHMDVNITGAMRVTHVFLAAMRDTRRGQIINIASVAGEFLITPNLVYGAAKHAMVAWSEGLALELEPYNIAVQVISPGRVETDFFRHPTFQQRVAGAETHITISMQHVIDVCVDTIIRRRKHVIIPAYWAVFAWALRACPWLLKPLYYAILRRRLARLQ